MNGGRTSANRRKRLGSLRSHETIVRSGGSTDESV
jgi:hypothetical protein